MSTERGEAPAAGAGSPRRLRVAVMDRDSGFVQVLVKRLGAHGYEHRWLHSAPSVDALVSLRAGALVLDPVLLGVDSWPYLERVCARLPGLAVVVCTGPSSVAQRVRGLRLGADAWITKPCHAEEVIALLQAAVRRARRAEAPVDAVSQYGEITIRPDMHQAYVGERSLELTAREFELLALLSATERVLRREEIYERVWGYAMAHGDRSVDVFVRKLRQKLRAASPGWNYIHTHFGVGYRFAPEPDLGNPDGSADVATPGNSGEDLLGDPEPEQLVEELAAEDA